MKTKKLIYLTLALCAILFIITSCGHVHNFGEWTVTKRPTCTEDGEQERYCSCGEKQTQAIPSTGHSFGEWKTIKNPTSTEAGEEERTCECGERQVRSIPELQDETTADTTVLTSEETTLDTPEQTTAPETTATPGITTELQHSHSFATAWSKNASQHWHECLCGEKKDVAVHAFGAWTMTKEATCTSTGSKKHVCTVCGYEESASVEKLAHTPVVDAAVAPTCTTPGKTEGSHCSVCNMVLTAQQAVPATGHSVIDWTVISEPTCTAKGQKKGACSVCGAYESLDIAPLGHNYVDTVVPPSVTAEGYTEHKCSRCKDSYKDAFVEATGSIGLAYNDNGDGTCTITGIGTCSDVDIYVPSIIGNLSVVEIGERAFENQTAIKSIYLPDSITKIGRRAYYGCSNLKESNIPLNIMSFGEQVFYKSGIETVVYTCNIIYNGTVNGDSIFRGTPLKQITFNGQYVPPYVCYKCTSLTDVIISESVTSIEEYAFEGCTSLASFTIPGSITRINHYAFLGCTGLTSITIPDSVTSIGWAAFQDCTGLLSIELPGSVTVIEGETFKGCESLSSIIIPNSVTSIGQNAFEDCIVLTRLDIPDSVMSIDFGVFVYCYNLSDIYYNGTMSEWYEIFKEKYTENLNVHCLDGICQYIKPH